jgi:5-oxoprolinase (ATP-hydrolysing) subunit A
MQILKVDLNSDMGEGFGVYCAGDDQSLLDVVTSANVACGFHAGDPEIMARTFQLAKDRGVNVGAHPGFPDLWGFGRRVMPYSPAEIERLVAYQIGAAQALSTYAGNPITYVKAHGALGNLTEPRADVATAVCRAVKAVDRSLICMSFSGGTLLRIAQDMGLSTCAEIFADRGYTEEGRLVPRDQPGAMIHNPQVAAARALRMVQSGAVESTSGKQIKLPVESICIHGDSAEAVAMARLVRQTLERAGIRITSFVPNPNPREHS